MPLRRTPRVPRVLVLLQYDCSAHACTSCAVPAVPRRRARESPIDLTTSRRRGEAAPVPRQSRAAGPAQPGATRPSGGSGAAPVDEGERRQELPHQLPSRRNPRCAAVHASIVSTQRWARLPQRRLLERAVPAHSQQPPRLAYVGFGGSGDSAQAGEYFARVVASDLPSMYSRYISRCVGRYLSARPERDRPKRD